MSEHTRIPNPTKGAPDLAVLTYDELSALLAERDRLRKLLERVYREGVWAQGDEGTGPAIRRALEGRSKGMTDAGYSEYLGTHYGGRDDE